MHSRVLSLLFTFLAAASTVAHSIEEQSGACGMNDETCLLQSRVTYQKGPIEKKNVLADLEEAVFATLDAPEVFQQLLEVVVALPAETEADGTEEAKLTSVHAQPQLQDLVRRYPQLVSVMPMLENSERRKAIKVQAMELLQHPDMLKLIKTVLEKRKRIFLGTNNNNEAETSLMQMRALEQPALEQPLEELLFFAIDNDNDGKVTHNECTQFIEHKGCLPCIELLIPDYQNMTGEEVCSAFEINNAFDEATFMARISQMMQENQQLELNEDQGHSLSQRSATNPKPISELDVATSSTSTNRRDSYYGYCYGRAYGYGMWHRGSK